MKTWSRNYSSVADFCGVRFQLPGLLKVWQGKDEIGRVLTLNSNITPNGNWKNLEFWSHWHLCRVPWLVKLGHWWSSSGRWWEHWHGFSRAGTWLTHSHLSLLRLLFLAAQPVYPWFFHCFVYMFLKNRVSLWSWLNATWWLHWWGMVCIFFWWNFYIWSLGSMCLKRLESLFYVGAFDMQQSRWR